jgi:hypothetical protein
MYGKTDIHGQQLRFWKQVVVAHFKVILRYSHGERIENLSGQQVTQPGFEKETR